MGWLRELMGWWGRRWGRLERWASGLLRGAGRKGRQLEAGARLIGAEVIQLGAEFWAPIDALSFVPRRFAFTPVRTQYYGHGAFMGAAPALFADKKWRRILAFLMPDVFGDIKAALDGGADVSAMMPMMENNPVLAAFGTLRSVQLSRGQQPPNHLAGMEWDLFIDNEIITEWEASDAAGKAACMKRVLDTALIAHANAADTVQENMGVCQYADVRKTAKSGFGGVEIDAWLDLFGRALALAAADDLDAAVAAMAAEPRVETEEACALHTFARPWPVSRVVELHRAATDREFISVILDIKSLRSTPAFLRDVVSTLNGHGVHVVAVGSFLREEVEGVGELAQVVGGRTLAGPREIQFFHYCGDLQAACDEGRIQPGQSVMFNGASLLDVSTVQGRHVYSGKLEVVRDLERYRRRFDLQIGFYVQEGDCDADAAAVLSDLVDAAPDTFTLGFAWGGLRDEAGLAQGEAQRLGYGSQKLLGAVGKAKQWELRG